MVNNKNKKIISLLGFLVLFIVGLLLVMGIFFGLKKLITTVENKLVIGPLKARYEIEIIYVDGFKDTIQITTYANRIFKIDNYKGAYILVDDYGNTYNQAVIRCKTLSKTNISNKIAH